MQPDDGIWGRHGIITIIRIMKISEIMVCCKKKTMDHWPDLYFCCAPIFFDLYDLSPKVKKIGQVSEISKIGEIWLQKRSREEPGGGLGIGCV